MAPPLDFADFLPLPRQPFFYLVLNRCVPFWDGVRDWGGFALT